MQVFIPSRALHLYQTSTCVGIISRGDREIIPEADVAHLLSISRHHPTADLRQENITKISIL